MNRIRELRLKREMSQDDCVELFNKNTAHTISKATWSRWENDLNSPVETVWQELADLFGVSVTFIKGTDRIVTNINPVSHTKNYAVIMNDATYSPFATEEEAREFLEEKCDE